MSEENETPREAANRTIRVNAFITVVLFCIFIAILAGVSSLLERKIDSNHACQDSREFIDVEWLCIDAALETLRPREDGVCPTGQKTLRKVTELRGAL